MALHNPVQNSRQKTQQAGSEMSVTPGIAVIGIGNILFGDEGLGVYGVAYLQANYDFCPAVSLIDGGTLGMNLVDVLLSYPKVLIIDTLSVGKKEAPGALYHLPAEALQGLGSYRRTAHEIEVLQALELASLAGHENALTEVWIIGMVPANIEQVTIGLSPAIEAQWRALTASAIQQLQAWGVEVHARPQSVPLQQVIDGYREGRLA
jgi:hydrogenase maturation protease